MIIIVLSDDLMIIIKTFLFCIVAVPCGRGSWLESVGIKTRRRRRSTRELASRHDNTTNF